MYEVFIVACDIYETFSVLFDRTQVAYCLVELLSLFVWFVPISYKRSDDEFSHILFIFKFCTVQQYGIRILLCWWAIVWIPKLKDMYQVKTLMYLTEILDLLVQICWLRLRLCGCYVSHVLSPGLWCVCLTCYS